MIDRRKQKKEKDKKIYSQDGKERKSASYGGEKTSSKIQKSKQQTNKTGQKSRNCRKERTADQKTKDI